MRYPIPLTILLVCVLMLNACARKETAPVTTPPAAVTPPALSLQPVAFVDLPGWEADDFRPFAMAYQKSCARILRSNPEQAFGALAEAGTLGPWQGVCRAMQTLDMQDHAAIRAFVERHFVPHAVLADGKPEGRFTGYYEASLRGSRTPSPTYHIPLHARPDDLVMVDLGAFRDTLKGQRIAGRVRDGQLHPYETRAQIVAGQWPHHHKVLVWVDDPIEAFFVQIQGSGVVELAEGGTLRIGYAGQNGHPYSAIGKELINRGALTREQVSMQSIRAWLASHPQQADEVMNTNASYVFFREVTEEGPLGGEQVVLTPGRSLAVDRSLLAYGMPMWVDIAVPNMQRLMVAQDTGGAIRGPVRGDVFWGYGPEAAAQAGAMNSLGRYWVLLPR